MPQGSDAEFCWLFDPDLPKVQVWAVVPMWRGCLSVFDEANAVVVNGDEALAEEGTDGLFEGFFTDTECGMDFLG